MSSLRILQLVARQLGTMAELMKNPEVMSKVQAEVRNIFNQQGAVDESEFHKLKYLNLVINEILRLHSLAQLLLPQFNSEACIINGFRVQLRVGDQ